MKICTFFGHNAVYNQSDIEARLIKAINSVLDCYDDTFFWISPHGVFDWFVRSVLENHYSFDINNMFLVYVYAYPPKLSKEKEKWLEEKDYSIIYPRELEHVPKRAAIPARNKYVAEHADIIICCIDHDYGAAYEAVKTAQKANKKIINIADSDLFK